MNTSDFAVFILTHGRADNVITYKTLRSQGYTGRIVLVVDDEDNQIAQYKKIYGDQVFVFPKQKAIDMTDCGDNFGTRGQIIFARNYSFEIAKELGLTYFLQFDDDYSQFRYTFDNDRRYITRQISIKNMDIIIEAMLEFYISIGVLTVCMSQGGDFIGGEGSKVATLHREGKMSRKAMNSFFCSVERPFKFVGGINEDVNTYTSLQNRGGVFLTFPRIRLEQKQTQSNEGGMTDSYTDLGTYLKSFHTVMYAPSFVKITTMGVKNRRLHHRVNWNNACPLILHERFCKNIK